VNRALSEPPEDESSEDRLARFEDVRAKVEDVLHLNIPRLVDADDDDDPHFAVLPCDNANDLYTLCLALVVLRRELECNDENYGGISSGAAAVGDYEGDDDYGEAHAAGGGGGGAHGGGAQHMRDVHSAVQEEVQRRFEALEKKFEAHAAAAAAAAAQAAQQAAKERSEFARMITELLRERRGETAALARSAGTPAATAVSPDEEAAGAGGST
jgi:hypothetical protein